MIGGCRNAEDEERVAALKALCAELSLELDKDVQIHTNIAYKALQEWLSSATIGLHTMTDEHFGIGVVEFMAAGYVGFLKPGL